MRQLKPFRLASLRHRRQPLAVLACVALLLLLVMPTTGRLLGKFAAGAHGAEHTMAMADGAPMAMPDATPATPHAGHAGHGQHPAVPDGHGQHPDHGSCPYCPLLGSVVAWSPDVAVPAARHDPILAPAPRHLAYAGAWLHGLGARGPPARL